MSEVIKRAGTKCIKIFTPDENLEQGTRDEVTGIITFKGKLVIATKHGVYMYPRKKKGAVCRK